MDHESEATPAAAAAALSVSADAELSVTAAATLSVTVAADALTAWLEVVEAASDEETPAPSMDDAQYELSSAGVVFGIDASAIEQALSTPGTAVVVARGRAPVDGRDGSVDYAASLLAVGGRPHVNESGEVNLFDLDIVHNVAPGTVLATHTPPARGEDGMDVFGHVIAHRPGRSVRARTGAGTALNDDALHITATTAGHALLVGTTVTVSAIYHVRGDVGPATGHIDFVGSVTVTGDVAPGFRVKAAGDVEIQGSVESGDVEAGGNVSVRYGIRGHNGHGRVVAGGTVRAKFIEYANVHAGEAVFASDGIVCSIVDAGATIEVLGSHGAIVGGSVVGVAGVRVRDLGSARSVVTEVKAGSSPTLIGEAERLHADKSELVTALKRGQERLSELQEFDRTGRLNQIGRDEMARVHEAYRALIEARAELQARQAELVERLRATRLAAIDVRGLCHAGVRVWLGDATCEVRQEWQGVRFRRNQQTHQVDLLGLDANEARPRDAA